LGGSAVVGVGGLSTVLAFAAGGATAGCGLGVGAFAC